MFSGSAFLIYAFLRYAFLRYAFCKSGFYSGPAQALCRKLGSCRVQRRADHLVHVKILVEAEPSAEQDIFLLRREITIFILMLRKKIFYTFAAAKSKPKV